MSSDNEWRISQVLSTAFQKQAGFKGTYLVALVIYVAIRLLQASLLNRCLALQMSSPGQASGVS